jgi:hypothetical protein
LELIDEEVEQEDLTAVEKGRSRGDKHTEWQVHCNMDRGEEIEMTEEVVKEAAENGRSGKGVMMPYFVDNIFISV